MRDTRSAPFPARVWGSSYGSGARGSGSRSPRVRARASTRGQPAAVRTKRLPHRPRFLEYRPLARIERADRSRSASWQPPGLEVELQRELNPARVLRAGDGSELRGIEAGGRREKISAIEKIECLGPYGQAQRLADGKRLGERNVPGLENRREVLREEAPRIAESEPGRIHERRSVEIIVQPLANASRRAAGDARAIRPLCGVATVERAGCIGRVHRNRRTALQSSNSGDAPAAGDRVH